MNTEQEALPGETQSQEKSRSTAWLIRCSQEQKDFFQKVSAESGKNAADFILSSIENYKIKSNLSENSAIQKDLQESEYLIERLTSLIRSKILVLSEKEIQFQSDLELHNNEKRNLQKNYEENEKILKEEFENQSEKIIENFTTQIQNLENTNEELKKNHEITFDKLLQKQGDLENRLQQKINENQILQKQVSDSMRLYESVEERNTELKKTSEKFEKENEELKKQSDRCYQLDKLIDQLNHKIEIMQMTHEQEIKYLHSEHELKLKIKEQEIENIWQNKQTVHSHSQAQ